jgi:hypothetical protein
VLRERLASSDIVANKLYLSLLLVGFLVFAERGSDGDENASIRRIFGRGGYLGVAFGVHKGMRFLYRSCMDSVRWDSLRREGFRSAMDADMGSRYMVVTSSGGKRGALPVVIRRVDALTSPVKLRRRRLRNHHSRREAWILSFCGHFIFCSGTGSVHFRGVL